MANNLVADLDLLDTDMNSFTVNILLISKTSSVNWYVFIQCVLYFKYTSMANNFVADLDLLDADMNYFTVNILLISKTSWRRLQVTFFKPRQFPVLQESWRCLLRPKNALRPTNVSWNLIKMEIWYPAFGTVK